MNDYKVLAIALGVLLFGICLVLSVFVIIGAKLTVGSDIARVEQLRRDASKATTGNNEDILGQVTQWNQTIQSYHWYNKRWWADLYVPDEWDDVKVIEIPQQ